MSLCVGCATALTFACFQCLPIKRAIISKLPLILSKSKFEDIFCVVTVKKNRSVCTRMRKCEKRRLRSRVASSAQQISMLFNLFFVRTARGASSIARPIRIGKSSTTRLLFVCRPNAFSNAARARRDSRRFYLLFIDGRNIPELQIFLANAKPHL